MSVGGFLPLFAKVSSPDRKFRNLCQAVPKLEVPTSDAAGGPQPQAHKNPLNPEPLSL